MTRKWTSGDASLTDEAKKVIAAARPTKKYIKTLLEIIEEQQTVIAEILECWE